MNDAAKFLLLGLKLAPPSITFVSAFSCWWLPSLPVLPLLPFHCWNLSRVGSCAEVTAPFIPFSTSLFFKRFIPLSSGLGAQATFPGAAFPLTLCVIYFSLSSLFLSIIGLHRGAYNVSGRQRQESQEFKASLGYVLRSHAHTPVSKVKPEQDGEVPQYEALSEQA